MAFDKELLVSQHVMNSPLPYGVWVSLWKDLEVAADKTDSVYRVTCKVKGDRCAAP